MISFIELQLMVVERCIDDFDSVGYEPVDDGLGDLRSMMAEDNDGETERVFDGIDEPRYFELDNAERLERKLLFLHDYLRKVNDKRRGQREEKSQAIN